MRIAGAAGVAGAIAFGSGPASADLGPSSCPIPLSQPVFSPFGDDASYFLASGGDFENGLSWSSSGWAYVAAGNEPFMLNAPTDRSSLRLRKHARVTTPRFCVTPEMPHLRFVAKANNGGRLDVRVRTYSLDGRVVSTSTRAVSAWEHDAWAPSRNVDLETRDMALGTVRFVDVTFDSDGDWTIDDVFVDPFAR